MNVFLAGATGAIGQQLVPRLVAAGHRVHGMTRSDSKASMLEALGAVPVVADALDPDQVAAAVGSAKPEVIIHELTAIGSIDPRHLDRDFGVTNRLRTEGTDHLLSAGQAAGVRRFIAQSYGSWWYVRTGGPVKTEEDPLDPTPAREMRQSFAAVRHLEQAVLGAGWTEGIVLRYGSFYGPGTSMAPDGSSPRWSAGAGFRWWATAVACGPSSTSPTRRTPRWQPSRTVLPASTTSSTMIPPRSPSGCRRSLASSMPESRCTCRAWWAGCLRGRRQW